jgi:hypothetical protein
LYHSGVVSTPKIPLYRRLQLDKNAETNIRTRNFFILDKFRDFSPLRSDPFPLLGKL